MIPKNDLKVIQYNKKSTNYKKELVRTQKLRYETLKVTTAERPIFLS